MAHHLSSARTSISLVSYLLLLLLLLASSAVHASPLRISGSSSPLSLPSHSSSPLTLIRTPRRNAILTNATGTVQVINPSTQQFVPQGPATDGAGAGFDAPAITWIAFSAVVGLPLSVAGFRGRRATTGVGIGLAGAVLSWSALINTVSSTGISDLLLTLIVLGFFLIGLSIGFLRLAHQVGLACLGIAGGIAFGVRVVLLRRGLLFPGEMDGMFAGDWILSAGLGALGGVSLVWGRWERVGVLFACASTGSFLDFLAVDLVLNKQGGMSRGLRFLFDRNTSHLADIISTNYSPPLSTFILIGVSLGMTPLLAYLQHRFFSKHTFRPSSDSDSVYEDEKSPTPQAQLSKPRWTRRDRDLMDPEPGLLRPPVHGENGNRQPSGFFADLWDAARIKSANRFSV